MAKRKPLKIAGTRIAAGTTQNLNLKFSESYLGATISVPIRVMRAKRSGPRVFISGAIHGDELTGIGIIRSLLYDRPPELKKGTLICIPVVNVYGLEHHSRYLPDRRDLNRMFPGSATGSQSSRLAQTIFRDIVKQCDYGIDFHSAAVRRTNYPNVRADMRNVEVKKLARAFGCELIVSNRGPDGSLRREAVRAGVPTIILEAGEVWKNEPGIVAAGLRGCQNVLKSLGMIEGDIERPIFQHTVKKTVWVRAQRGGFLGFHAKPGDLVAEGQELATNYNIFGRERRILTSPCHGIILGMTTMPAVKPGEPVYHVATVPRRTFYRIRKKIDAAADDSHFAQIQEDLSTNINLEEPNQRNST